MPASPIGSAPTPTRLSDKHRAELARDLGVEVCELDRVLEARKAWNTYINDRIDYRGGVENL